MSTDDDDKKDFKEKESDFLSHYQKIGKDQFYRFLLTLAIQKLAKGAKEKKKISPELEYLDIYEKCIILYRRNSNELYLDIAKVFRKAAYKIYRLMLQKGMTERNAKFFNIVIKKAASK